MLYLLLCIFTSRALALSISAHRPGYIDFVLRKAAKNQVDLAKDLQLDGKVINASLANSQFYYQIRLDIGTPAQAVDFTIDTGSSDLWVMASSNPYCSSDPLNKTGINCTGSVFDYEKSKTFIDLDQPFDIAYGDRTFANGTLVSDTVYINKGAAVLNATFGVAKTANSSTCVFGIGFTGDEGEAHVHRNKTGVYPTYFNVPALMKQQGLIDTNAYSLWLNDVNADEGSILFGGIDRSKFDGPLTVMPIYNNYNEYTEHPIQTRVMLNSVKADNSTLCEFNIAVLLDSGTSFSYLPQEILDAFGKSLGFDYEDDIGYYVGSSATALDNVHEFRLNFSGAEIKIPTSDLLVDLTQDDGTPFTVDGKHLSILTMGAVNDSYSYILGDVFLRSMYAVFDLDHYEIALAQSRKNVTGVSDVSVIDASIPGAIQAAAYASTSTNNSVFHIYPFTPLVPAPSVVTISMSYNNGTMPAISTSTAVPPSTVTATVAATATVTTTTITTTTTTVGQPGYTDASGASWLATEPMSNPQFSSVTIDTLFSPTTYQGSSEQPAVTLYWNY